MRVFFGMILGVLLTVGAAYVHDAGTVQDSVSNLPRTEQRPMVNWDVVAENWHQLSARLRQQWEKISNG
jgi:heme O synthase-like polyprenyltransferase